MWTRLDQCKHTTLDKSLTAKLSWRDLFQMLCPPVSQYQYDVYVQNIISKLRAEMLRKYFQKKKGFVVDDFFIFYCFTIVLWFSWCKKRCSLDHKKLFWVPKCLKFAVPCKDQVNLWIYTSFWKENDQLSSAEFTFRTHTNSIGWARSNKDFIFPKVLLWPRKLLENT